MTRRPGWPSKRIAALVLTIGLVVLAGYSVAQGILGTLPLLGMGIVLGGLYVWRGGSLPDWAYRIRNKSRGEYAITRDDAPSNLPARVFLPILLGVLLLAVLIFAVFLKK